VTRAVVLREAVIDVELALVELMANRKALRSLRSVQSDSVHYPKADSDAAGAA
jgi:hypothetical protein